MPRCPFVSTMTPTPPATVDSANTGNKGVGLRTFGADTDVPGFAGNAAVADIDIVIPSGQITPGTDTDGDVIAPGRITVESIEAFGHIVVASGVMKHALDPLAMLKNPVVLEKRAFVSGGHVVNSSGVVKERLKTVSQVVAAGGVAIERINTAGRVVAAGGVAKESK